MPSKNIYGEKLIEGKVVRTKICSRCKVEKPFYEYSKSKAEKSGIKPACKKCVKKLYTPSKEKQAMYDKKHYEKHKERINKEKRAKYQENKDEIIKKKMNYYWKNRDSISERRKELWRSNEDYVIKARLRNRKYYHRKYKGNLEYKKKQSERYQKRYEERRDEILEKNRLYARSERGREKLKQRDQYRRAKTKEFINTFTFKDWKECKIHFDNTCAYCGCKSELERDHFVPLSSGGEFTRGNIIPACVSCNRRKHTKNFFEWYPRQDFYSKTREKKILKYLGIKNNEQQIVLL